MKKEIDPKIYFAKQLIGVLKKAGVSYYRDGDYVVRFSLDNSKGIEAASQVTLEAKDQDRDQPTPDVTSENIDFEFSHT